MKSKVKKAAKIVIAIVVVVGLILAARSALNQWNEQRAVALDRVSEIEQAIAAESSEAKRRELAMQLDTARESVPDLLRLDWRLVGGAFICYLLGLIPGGVVLYEATRVLGYRVGLREAISAQIVGHLGKYVPGKAMVVVIRAGRLVGEGVPILAGSIAVFLETLLMMAVGAALAGCLVFFLPVERWIAWVALIGGIAATIPTLPPLLKWVVRKAGMAESESTEPGGGETSTATDPRKRALNAISHDWRFFVSAWFWQLIAWGLIGASFACLVESIPGAAREYSSLVVYLSSTAAIALAMVAGFASLLPGGAGVRELTLAIVLTPVIGATQALLAAILARLLFIAVELIAVFLVTIARPK